MVLMRPFKCSKTSLKESAGTTLKRLTENNDEGFVFSAASGEEPRSLIICPIII